MFSPHPDDDVISMGATIKKLVEHGNHVYIVYMTSGANGVCDDDAQKYFYFLEDIMNSRMFDENTSNDFTEFYKSFKGKTDCATNYFKNQNTQKCK